MTNKLTGKRALIIAPVIAVLAAFMFSCAMYPMANADAKDIPIAIVSEDKGIQVPGNTVNAGNMMLENVKKVAGKSGAMDIKVVDSEDKAVGKVEDGKYCAALVIPADFTAKQMAAATPKPTAAEFKVYINQGKFGMTATLTEQALTKMIDNAGSMLQPQILKSFTAAGVNISAEQAAYYAESLTSNIEYINPVKSTGAFAVMNANVLSAMITWIASLILAIIMYMYYKKEKVTELKYSVTKISIQIGIGLINAFILALLICFILTGFVGFDIPFGATFMYLGLAIFCVAMLIIGVLRWTGIAGAALFVIVMFLCMPTASLSYEILPEFWQNWIYPWSPVRYISDGLKEVYFISGDWINSKSTVLIYMGGIGIGLSYLSLLYREKIGTNDTGNATCQGEE